MNRLHQRRLYYVLFATVTIATATGLILYALKKNINAFMTPSQVTAHALPADYHFSLGGLVKKESFVREKTGLKVHFILTDQQHEIHVDYTGILPDLFREGKGAIAEGHLAKGGRFIATRVLAKHDENYTPPRLKQAMGERA
jgi:cytochrome c-type biogenesis protein CcmE